MADLSAVDGSRSDAVLQRLMSSPRAVGEGSPFENLVYSTATHEVAHVMTPGLVLPEIDLAVAAGPDPTFEALGSHGSVLHRLHGPGDLTAALDVEQA